MTQRMESCNKGLAKEMASTWQALGKVLARCWHTLSCSMSLLRVWQEYGKEQARSSLEYGKEQARSRQGAGKSMLRVCLGHAGRIQAEFGENSRRIQGEFRLNSQRMHLLRFVACLILIVVGVGEMWGQTAQDYSGTYYIGSNSNSTGYKTTPADNYYICPTEEWIYYKPTNSWDTNGPTYPNPFLTTYKCRSNAYHSGDASNAVWTIEKAPNSDYYYIKHNKDGKYWVSNGQISGTSNANRMRVHLEAVADENLDDKVLFEITPYSDNKSIVISPVSSAGWNGDYKWYTVNNGNKDYLVGNGSNGGPSGYTATGGIIGLYTRDDVNARFVFEDILQPVFEQQDDNTITITCPGCSIYYTTDGSRPDPANAGGNNPTQIYEAGTTTISVNSSLTPIKAIAVKAKNADEALDTYSKCVTFTPKMLIGSNYHFLLQNVECTDFYMIPGNVSNGNTTVNTTSLFRSTMVWTFFNAGSEPGVQYYYIKNGSNYLYRTDNNIFLKTSSDFDNAENKDGYKFSLEQGYDSDSNPDGLYIIPKGTDNTYCIYKNGGNIKENQIAGARNTCKPENKHARWNIISTSENELPTSVTYDSNNPTDPNWPFFLSSSSANPSYFKIENVGTTGRYMSPSDIVGTATTGNEVLAWYIIEAGHDNWRKYYYIVHKSTGKYMKYNKATGSPGSNTNVISLVDYNNETSERYQFVFAKSTIDGGYYIVPKGLEDATYNAYYALLLSGEGINASKGRENNNYKWKFVPFCYNPVFTESGGSITLSCATNGAEIHYMTDGNDPTSSSTLYNSNSWLSSEQHVIKAQAFIMDGSTVTAFSDVVTLLNKPDVTLEAGPYVYKGIGWEPDVTVSIGDGDTKVTAPTSPTTYIPSYSNNINVGTNTATVTLTDADENDYWYIWNASATFTITPKTVTITAKDASRGYDGTALTEHGFITTDLEDGDTHIFTVVMTEESTITDIGYQSNVIASVDGVAVTAGTETTVGNYLVTTANGTLTITKMVIGDGYSPADGITYLVDKDENDNFVITVMQAGNPDPLRVGTEGTDYDYSLVQDQAGTTDKYYKATITGANNYTGSFSVRYAYVNFQPDIYETEWAATFVAEGADVNNPNSSKGHALVDGITAYIITSIVDDGAIAEELDYIPEGIPVVLVSDKAATGFVVNNVSGQTAPTSTNMLEVVTANSAHFNTRTIYLLHNDEFVYNIEGDLGKGMVYLNPNHSGGGGGNPAPARLRIKKKDDTGIEDTHFLPLTSHLSDVWYTLDGRRLNGKPMERGLYIVNGKKVMVK